MIYYIVTIIILTLIFVGIYRSHLVKVCPICAGVVITWLIGIFGIYTHASWANPLIIAILMGASLGALADKYGSRFGIIWKSGVVILGLPAIYLLVQNRFWTGLVFLAAIFALTLVLSKPSSSNKSDQNHDLFKNCC